MKKVFLFSIILLMVLLGLSSRKEVKAELLPFVRYPYSFERELEFQKTASGEAHTIVLSKDVLCYEKQIHKPPFREKKNEIQDNYNLK